MTASFKPKHITRDLLKSLSTRARTVLQDRFGLGNESMQRTLDAIGKQYGITRERVRQIEKHSILSIQNSDRYDEHGHVWKSFEKILSEIGGVAAEHVLLKMLATNIAERNHLAFLLNVFRDAHYRRETDEFYARWTAAHEALDQVERALAALYESIDADTLLSESELEARFARMLKDEGMKARGSEILRQYVQISKRLDKNPLGEWGRIESSQVRIKNTRDYAYLTLKRHGSPMHFIEVAKAIENLFDRNTHPATTHNELIKDSRFVLVGRGLYALSEWGYAPGVVRDVIRTILEREGPLERDAIVEMVKRERYVKDATIAVNLQHGIFTKLADGRYALVG